MSELIFEIAAVNHGSFPSKITPRIWGEDAGYILLIFDKVLESFDLNQRPLLRKDVLNLDLGRLDHSFGAYEIPLYNPSMVSAALTIPFTAFSRLGCLVWVSHTTTRFAPLKIFA